MLDRSPSAFQFGIAALLILTAAVAVIVRFGEPFLRWLDDLGAPVEFALHVFVIVTSLACPWFVFRCVQVLRHHRRYWVLAATLMAASATVLATWLVLFLGIGRPEPDPKAFLDLSGFGWAMACFAVIFHGCLIAAALGVTLFFVRRAERRAQLISEQPLTEHADEKKEGQKNEMTER